MGLDLEMQIYEHYFEVLDVVEKVFETIFNGLATQCGECTISSFPGKGRNGCRGDAGMEGRSMDRVAKGTGSEETQGADFSGRVLEQRFRYPPSLHLLLLWSANASIAQRCVTYCFKTCLQLRNLP